MNHSSLKVKYYKNLLLSIKQRVSSGDRNIVKPVLLISVFDKIVSEQIINNRIYYDTVVSNTYEDYCSRLISSPNAAPLVYPYYYMRNDGFWHLVGVNSNIQWKRTPLAKYIKENIQYALLDNALWDLLQDRETRDYLREEVYNFFFKIIK